jgi:deoxyribose-phosphate aldolase
MRGMTAAELAARIDHTLLKAEATAADVAAVTDEAIEHGFASVCVNGHHLPQVAQALSNTPSPTGRTVKPCAVAGFPLGAGKSMVKTIEATSLAKDGALEIDFVAHLPDLLAEDVDAARRDFAMLVEAVRDVRRSTVVKVIIESAALLAGVSDDRGEARIAAACRAATEAGCDFVKTSTGFHPAGGASVRAVKWMSRHAPALQVKASGGIRTRDDALAMIDAGADRLGCSAGVAIVAGGTGESDY